MEWSTTMKLSPVDIMTAILTGKLGAEGIPPLILATSFVALLGIAVFFLWRRSASAKTSRPAEPPRSLVAPKEPEPEVEDGGKKVIMFFGTQTDTAEGFADRVSIVSRQICRSSNIVSHCSRTERN